MSKGFAPGYTVNCGFSSGYSPVYVMKGVPSLQYIRTKSFPILSITLSHFHVDKNLWKNPIFLIFFDRLPACSLTDSENRNRVGGLGSGRLTPVLTTRGSKYLITISAFGIRSFTHKNFLTLKNQYYSKYSSDTIFDNNMICIIYVWARNF